MQIILRQKLNYALSYNEGISILKDKDNEVKIDGKVRRNPKFPVGLMDVVTIPKTKDQFRVFFDEKRRFTFVKLKDRETNEKLLKIVKVEIGANKLPYMVTHDARTIRFPDPSYHVGDTIQWDLNNEKILKHFTLAPGHLGLVTSGNNLGRIGTIQSIVKKHGGVAVVTLKDDKHHVFNTRVNNVFVIGENKPACSIPKSRGIRYTVGEIVEKLIEEDERDD